MCVSATEKKTHYKFTASKFVMKALNFSDFSNNAHLCDRVLSTATQSLPQTSGLQPDYTVIIMLQ